MRSSLVAFLILGACAPEAALTEEALASRWTDQAPEWADHAIEIDRVGPLALLALDPVRGPEQTDVRPARAIVLARDDGSFLLPLEPVVHARIVGTRVAWVTVDGALVIDDGAGWTFLDREAIPELDVQGEVLAWARRPGPEAGVLVLEPGAQPRLVTSGLMIADRPLFDGDRLIVVGARASGIAGVWSVRWRERGEPAPVTNAELRAGEPLGDRFVPPPADHASMRIEGGVLAYHDGRGEQRIEVGP